MHLLIDGYNLMHAAGMMGRKFGPGGLHRARSALLNFLTEALDEVARRGTIIVFDASRPPFDAPPGFKHAGMTVCFATGYDDADTMIEELIRGDSAPKRLTVVSSDHRLRQAARRRKAHGIESETWYEQQLRDRRQRDAGAPALPFIRPEAPANSEEVAYWLTEFGVEETPPDDDDIDRLLEE